MSKDANIEALKPQYTRIQKDFAATRTKKYSDLTVIEIIPFVYF